MIDYEKLEQAWRLMGDVLKEHELRKLDKKLHELTKPGPKHKEGQYVWLMGPNNQPVDCYIQDVYLSSDVKYLIEDAWFREEQLYPSREELIESQVTYWLGMLEMPDQIRYFAKQAKPITCTENKEKSTCCDDVSMTCEHESDGTEYCIMRGEDGVYKCKKCGEFYR